MFELPSFQAPGQRPGAAEDTYGSVWRRVLRRLARGLWRLSGGPPAAPQRRAGDDHAALARLQRNEEQLRLAEQVAQVGSFEWYPVSGELHWSDQHFRLWGHAPGALKPDYAVFRAGIHPDDVSDLEQRLQRALAGGRFYDCAHRVVWPDGSVRRIQGRGEVMFDAAGVAVRMIGTVRDTTAEHAAQAALAHSVDNLTLTLNATGDGIFASDAHGPDEPLLFVNERLLQIWDIAPGAAATLTPAGVIRAARHFFVDPDREIARIHEIIAGNLAAEDRLHLNDGRVLIRRCVATVADGRHVRVWGFRDVTAEARAEQAVREAEVELRALLDAFPGYIARVDENLRFSYVNARLAEAMGDPVAGIVGRSIDRAVPPVDGDGTGSSFGIDVRRAMAGEQVVCERLQPVHGRSAPIDLLVTLAPGRLQPDGRRQVYAFGTDITALKASEAALVQARDAAEAASRAKSAFLSSMSHELRTPMNAVLGFAQLMQSQGGLAPRQREYLGEIQRGGQHLLALINDLLDLARIEAGRLEVSPEPMALRPLVVESLALVQPAALRRGIRISLPDDDLGDVGVLADRTRLKQVLVNLLGNAVKYNHEGGWVRVAWSVAHDRINVTVRDGGPGLGEAQIQRLFQPFERLDAGRGTVEGTGIGLALCRRLLSLMGGAIGVDSEPGAGCCFSFDLPSAITAALPPPSSTAAAAAAAYPLSPGPDPGARPVTPRSGRRRVLYVEDNPVNALLMGGLLEALPAVDLRIAATPEEGLAIATAERPDLVLLDILMPGMDGYEVLDRLRAHFGGALPPVVAVTANALPQDRARAASAGFTAYLAKPLDVADLLRQVSRLLDLPGPSSGPRPVATPAPMPQPAPASVPVSSD